LKIKPEKVQLATNEINYLGYNLIQGQGIRAGLAKTEAIAKWTMPTNVKQIKQFLGLCSFFRRTIPNFAILASPLTKLTRKDADVENALKEPEVNLAFKNLKNALCKRPCLKPVDFEKPFILTVDSSHKGVGAILSQKSEFGKEHPCAYASRAFNQTEELYPPHRLEAAGILWACKHFKPYLIGKEFTIRTDHKPLVSLNRIDGQTLDRIRAEMEEFIPYKMEYLKGTNMPADGLSRLDLLTFRGSYSWEQLHHLQSQDKFCKAVICVLRFGTWPRDGSQQTNPPPRFPLPISNLPKVSRFNERVHIDLLGPLPLDLGNKYLLVCSDAFSSLIELVPIPNKSASTVANAFLTAWIGHHGCPYQINSDQGKEFMNSMFSTLCKTLCIDQVFSAVQHPQSNGQVERQMRVIIAYLRKYLSHNHPNDWIRLLPMLQFSYNSSCHSTKTLSPFMLAFCRKPILPSDIVDHPDLPTSYAEDNLSQRLNYFKSRCSEALRTHFEKSSANKAGKNAKLPDRPAPLFVGQVVYVAKPHGQATQFQKFQRALSPQN